MFREVYIKKIYLKNDYMYHIFSLTHSGWIVSLGHMKKAINSGEYFILHYPMIKRGITGHIMIKPWSDAS